MMSIFAIADLHLSGEPPAKPMNIFSPRWNRHWQKIREDWTARVSPGDTVLLAGDTSWAMTMAEAEPDLAEIALLPGTKLIVKGNHDYWWQTAAKMRQSAPPGLVFIHNSFSAAGEYAVCGSRGWSCPDEPSFSTEDMTIYRREAGRVRASLSAARAAGHRRLILMLHFPPLYRSPSRFTDLIREFGVEICLYGHLHGEEAHRNAPAGQIEGAACHLVACDALDFRLKQIV